VSLYIIRRDDAACTIYLYGTCMVLLYDRAAWHDGPTDHMFVSQYMWARDEQAEATNRHMFDNNILD
jgi:hypothetical protein